MFKTCISRIARPSLKSFSTSQVANKTIYVGNLSWSLRDDDLRQAFEQYGDVQSSRIVTDRLSGRSRGFGFVDMEDADADIAIEKMNGADLQGRALTVNESQPRPPREEGFSGGFERRERAPRRDFGEDRRGGRDFGESRGYSGDRSDRSDRSFGGERRGSFNRDRRTRDEDY